MQLSDLGLTKELSALINDHDLSEFSAGGVTREHHERYIVSDGESEFEADHRHLFIIENGGIFLNKTEF